MSLSETQKAKKKFRSSAKWEKFRKHIAEKFGHKDAITLKPLRKGYNVHHMNLSPNEYEKLVEDNFIPLNKTMHETIHTCYKYQATDSGFMDRLKYYVEKMVEINEGRDLETD